MERLSPLDVSFLHIENAVSHMHIGTIALFGYLNRWNDTMATELEPRAVEVAERAIGATGWQPGKHGG